MLINTLSYTHTDNSIILIADTILGSCISIYTQIRTYFKINILRYIVNGMFEY